jgi:RNA recognition motif-containing protein
LTTVQSHMSQKNVLYVGNLAEDVTPDVLRMAFIPFGDITDVTFPPDPAESAFIGPSHHHTLRHEQDCAFSLISLWWVLVFCVCEEQNRNIVGLGFSLMRKKRMQSTRLKT